MVYPIEHMGVKLLSLGFVSPKSGVPGASGDIHSGAAVMRGPMTSKVVTQLLKGTDWGDLDILLLDFPPGTGDVQLTVCQQLNLSGAVIVTTPSKLALVDAVKGVDMFQAMDVPTLALVENMAFFSVRGTCKYVFFLLFLYSCFYSQLNLLCI
jgi:Mrp family chromosome partitioning ATPase